MGSVAYLLDTHALLWLFYRNDLLPAKVLNLVNDEKVFVSSVSFWEISIKFHTGKLDLLGEKPETLEKFCFEQHKIYRISLMYFMTWVKLI